MDGGRLAARGAEAVRAYDVCTGGPDELLDATLCLAEVSKDLEGRLVPLQAEREECPALDCTTLTTRAALALEVAPHACDSRLAALLDGRLVVGDLTTVFVDGDAGRRGMHAGTVRWSGTGVRLQGAISGMTNVGTHREPAFEPAQRCDEQGVLEGRLCARVVRARAPELVGAQVLAVYRMRFELTAEGGEGPVRGTLEGVLVRACEGDDGCVEFSTLGSEANPRVEAGTTFTVADLGGPVAGTEVVTWGGTTGLHLWHSTTIDLAQPTDQVELVMAHFSSPASVTAFDSSGAAVSGATMGPVQGVPQTLVLTAPGIARLVVDAPQDETLLLRLCVGRA